jgi:23S rRNA pseudouridine1911/1915/1917 synthase
MPHFPREATSSGTGEPRILYEDDAMLALDKPAGLLVHGTSGGKRTEERGKGRGDEKTLVDWLLARYPQLRTVGDDPATRPGIVHRLDRDTSGVMLVAKTQAAFEHLKNLFKERAVSKTYTALVAGAVVPRSGRIDDPIGLKDGTTKHSIHAVTMRKPAVTDYSVIRSLRDAEGTAFSLLSVRPHTGRTHQIRVHLASRGYPIVGDRLYGRKVDRGQRTGKRGQGKEKREKGMKDGGTGARLMLHASAIELTVAPGRRMKFEAALPSDFRAVLAALQPAGARP